MNRRDFLIQSVAAAGATVLFPSNFLMAQQTALTWSPDETWVWWTQFTAWQAAQMGDFGGEEIYARNPDASGGGGFLTDWPDYDDETNYTFYTEEILTANIHRYFASGGKEPSLNLCKLINGLGQFTLAQGRAWLIANPELLEELAFILDCAPEAVLIMGILLMLTLVVLVAYC